MAQARPHRTALFRRNDTVILAGITTVFAGVLAYGVRFDNFAVGLTIGLLLLAASFGMAAWSRGGVGSLIGLPFLGMAMVGLMIHVSRGHNEAHFAVFAFMACLVVYRQALPIIAGAATIAVHHLSFNQFQAWGWGPMCFGEASFFRVVEHALFVIAESGVLLFLAARAKGEFDTAEELMEIAERLQADDGRIDLSLPPQRTKARVVSKLRESLTRIADTMSQVRQATDAIRAASGEIASGNAALSSRTEQASASLQETASSVDQIVATMQHSTDHAHQANALAGQASTVAVEGGAAVSRVVETMSGIQQSSRKITDIIGVIDGIAFQTNILALNAAVEAARAGEQGRGFAVVAGEVRTLAQRSAEAAKEIKQLITSSVAQVETGSALVDSTGSTIDQVVQQVRRVTELVGQITNSSTEQNHGIAQINTAIGVLDESTQRNAALVEETAAAAEGLARQADQLAQAVAVFKLEGAVA
ncbi:MAG TPA: chemotaxis protein [Candidatus Aquabacterium excrementipullorum]|nr:chemotaxis protein [Candidatus Aquabacterium excrementipullorum]